MFTIDWKRLLEAEGISLRRLARDTGIPYHQLHHIVNQNADYISREVVGRALTRLGVRLVTPFGINDRGQLTIDWDWLLDDTSIRKLARMADMPYTRIYRTIEAQPDYISRKTVGRALLALGYTNPPHPFGVQDEENLYGSRDSDGSAHEP